MSQSVSPRTNLQKSRVSEELEQLRQQGLAKSRRGRLKDSGKFVNSAFHHSFISLIYILYCMYIFIIPDNIHVLYIYIYVFVCIFVKINRSLSDTRRGRGFPKICPEFQKETGKADSSDESEFIGSSRLVFEAASGGIGRKKEKRRSRSFSEGI